MKKLLSLILVTYLLSCFTIVHADYVLPYPSFMPGNKMYRITRIVDDLKRFWYFGTLSQLKYHVGLSDKYLVEAKTLFEYKQYLLATDALKRSDMQLVDIQKLMVRGEAEKKDMSGLRQTVRESMDAHVSVLDDLESKLPEEFTWRPEKVSATVLQIGTLLATSLQIRQSIEEEVTGSAILHVTGK